MRQGQQRWRNGLKFDPPPLVQVCCKLGGFLQGAKFSGDKLRVWGGGGVCFFFPSFFWAREFLALGNFFWSKLTCNNYFLKIGEVLLQPVFPLLLLLEQQLPVQIGNSNFSPLTQTPRVRPLTPFFFSLLTSTCLPYGNFVFYFF